MLVNRTHRAEPCTLVIFGASGDLTSRKLFPAIYNLEKGHLLPSRFCLAGTAVNDWSDDEFRKRMREAVKRASGAGSFDTSLWNKFAKRMHYVRGDFHNVESYKELARKLEECDRECRTESNRIFYLATPPSLCPDIVRGLSAAGLAQPKDGAARVVVEKPFGRDLESAQRLNQEILRFFHEEQVYRIDHYLGKETVQNVLVFRFSSGLFEPIWNRRYVDNVQITVAEDLGVEHRAAYYEEAGAVRDMVQSHICQLLAMTAMEPPIAFDADSVRNEKVKVLKSVRQLSPKDEAKFAIRAQYRKGKIHGKQAKGYREEPAVDKNSQTETFAALKLFIDNWRWANVPFYVRTGKRLARRTTEIALDFREPPFPLFGEQVASGITTNVLTIRIQPEEGISLQFNAKRPGMAVEIEPVSMDFCYSNSFRTHPVEAYERLLHDCLIGDATLFARNDGIEAAWSIVTPILKAWERKPKGGVPTYEAGAWGPKEADELIKTDGRHWNLR